MNYIGNYILKFFLDIARQKNTKNPFMGDVNLVRVDEMLRVNDIF